MGDIYFWLPIFVNVTGQQTVCLTFRVSTVSAWRGRCGWTAWCPVHRNTQKSGLNGARCTNTMGTHLHCTRGKTIPTRPSRPNETDTHGTWAQRVIRVTQHSVLTRRVWRGSPVILIPEATGFLTVTTENLGTWHLPLGPHWWQMDLWYIRVVAPVVFIARINQSGISNFRYEQKVARILPTTIPWCWSRDNQNVGLDRKTLTSNNPLHLNLVLLVVIIAKIYRWNAQITQCNADKTEDWIFGPNQENKRPLMKTTQPSIAAYSQLRFMAIILTIQTTNWKTLIPRVHMQMFQTTMEVPNRLVKAAEPWGARIAVEELWCLSQLPHQPRVHQEFTGLRGKRIVVGCFSVYF